MATAANCYYPYFLFDHEVANEGPLDISPALDRTSRGGGFLNLIHQPCVFLGGIRDRQSPRFSELHDIEVFLLAAVGQGHGHHRIHWPSMERLTSLEEMYVGKGQIEVPGTELAHFLKYPRLRVLYLSGQPIGDEDLKYLETLPRLNELYLEKTDVSQVGVARLQRSLPNCRITW